MGKKYNGSIRKNSKVIVLGFLIFIASCGQVSPIQGTSPDKTENDLKENKDKNSFASAKKKKLAIVMK